MLVCHWGGHQGWPLLERTRVPSLGSSGQGLVSLDVVRPKQTRGLVNRGASGLVSRGGGVWQGIEVPPKAAPVCRWPVGGSPEELKMRGGGMKRGLPGHATWWGKMVTWRGVGERDTGCWTGWRDVEKGVGDGVDGCAAMSLYLIGTVEPLLCAARCAPCWGYLNRPSFLSSTNLESRGFLGLPQELVSLPLWSHPYPGACPSCWWRQSYLPLRPVGDGAVPWQQGDLASAECPQGPDDLWPFPQRWAAGQQLLHVQVSGQVWLSS